MKKRWLSLLMVCTMLATCLPVGFLTAGAEGESAVSTTGTATIKLTDGNSNPQKGHAMQWGYFLKNESLKQSIDMTQYGKHDVYVRFQLTLHEDDASSKLAEQLTDALKAALPDDNKEDSKATITESDWLPYIRTPRVTLKDADGKELTGAVQILSTAAFVKQSDGTWVWNSQTAVPLAARTTLGRVEVLVYNDLHSLLNDRYKQITGSNGSFAENEWGSKGVNITFGEQSLVIGQEELVTQFYWNTPIKTETTNNFGFDWSRVADGATGDHSSGGTGIDVSGSAANRMNPNYVLKADFTFTDLGANTAEEAWSELSQIYFRLRSYKNQDTGSNSEPGWTYLHLANRQDSEKDYFTIDGNTLHMAWPLSAMTENDKDNWDPTNAMQLNMIAERKSDKQGLALQMAISKVRIVDLSRDLLQEAVDASDNYLYTTGGDFANALADAKQALAADNGDWVALLTALQAAKTTDAQFEDHSKSVALSGPDANTLNGGADWMYMGGVANDNNGVHLYGDLNNYALQLKLTTTKTSLKASGFDNDYLIELRHTTGGEHVYGWYVNLQEIPDGDKTEAIVTIPLTPSEKDGQWGKSGAKVAQGVYIYRARTNNDNDDVRDVLHYITQMRMAKTPLKNADVTVSDIQVVDNTRQAMVEQLNNVFDFSKDVYVNGAEAKVKQQYQTKVAELVDNGDTAPLQDISETMTVVKSAMANLVLGETVAKSEFAPWNKLVNMAADSDEANTDWQNSNLIDPALDLLNGVSEPTKEDLSNMYIRFGVKVSNQAYQIVGGAFVVRQGGDTGTEVGFSVTAHDLVDGYALFNLNMAEVINNGNANDAERMATLKNLNNLRVYVTVKDQDGNKPAEAYTVTFEDIRIVKLQTVTVNFVGKYNVTFDSHTFVKGATPISEQFTDYIYSIKVPAMYGYVFSKWDAEVESFANQLDDEALYGTTQQITAYYAKDDTDAYTLAKDSDHHGDDITVASNGSALETYENLVFDQGVTVSVSDKTVAYWLLDGTKVGFGKTSYTFYVSGNNTIGVVYEGESTEAITADVVLQQAAIKRGDNGKSIFTVIAQTSIPNDAAVQEYGVIFSNKVDSLKVLTGVDDLSSSQYIQVVSSSTAANKQYMISLLNIVDGRTRVARAYAVLNDGSVIFSSEYAMVTTGENATTDIQPFAE